MHLNQPHTALHLNRTHITEKSTRKRAFFSYIRLRRVLLLRSDIRLTPSGIRFASLGGEYNITAERSEAISLLRKQKYHADKVSISLKAYDSEVFRNFVDAFRAFRVCSRIRTSEKALPKTAF